MLILKQTKQKITTNAPAHLSIYCSIDRVGELLSNSTWYLEDNGAFPQKASLLPSNTERRGISLRHTVYVFYRRICGYF